MGQKFGQHFLHDQEVLERIVEEVRILVNGQLMIEDGQLTVDNWSWMMTILEIGPGRGALTKVLMKEFGYGRGDEKQAQLILSEIDVSLQWLLSDLTQGKGIPIVRGDILEQELVVNDDGGIDFSGHTLDVDNTFIVGNLPYYITSPILRKFFGDHSVAKFPAWVFLIQKEVADKIRWDVDKKSYLRWLLNRTAKVHYAFTVKAESFSPPPKVTSAVIVVEKLASGSEINVNQERLLAFLDLTSSFKRKTLWKIQKMQKEWFERWGFSIPERCLGMRLEELWREEMGEIVKG
jgi:16S rRNA (adenine1518-N6/adenine1519-N6)-dimethyltransferase